MLRTDTTYAWSPKTAGEVSYFCMLHPWMVGKIIVGSVSTEVPKSAPVPTNVPKSAPVSTYVPKLVPIPTDEPVSTSDINSGIPDKNDRLPEPKSLSDTSSRITDKSWNAVGNKFSECL